jgi:nitroimidazol reductase NimA-like FMN-containing flavoprotein (pyridoxamine 5'-phosphate oxidase superfamily)
MPEKKFNTSHKEMERFLREETLGYLGLSMDGQPYSYL